MVHGQGIIVQQLPKIYRGWGPDETSSHKRLVFLLKSHEPTHNKINFVEIN